VNGFPELADQGSIVIQETMKEDFGPDSGNLAHFSFGLVELAWKVSRNVNDVYGRGRI
jgi:hypothetical protein